MQASVNDPKHWQKRAAEARAIAEQLKDPEARLDAPQIAHGNDRLAAHSQTPLGKFIDAIGGRSHKARPSFWSALQAPVVGQPQVISLNSDRPDRAILDHLPKYRRRRWRQGP